LEEIHLLVCIRQAEDILLLRTPWNLVYHSGLAINDSHKDEAYSILAS
jgi:hypothetical protein